MIIVTTSGRNHRHLYILFLSAPGTSRAISNVACGALFRGAHAFFASFIPQIYSNIRKYKRFTQCFYTVKHSLPWIIPPSFNPLSGT